MSFRERSRDRSLVAVASASSKFGRYKPEPQSESRILNVEASPGVARLLDIWEKFLPKRRQIGNAYDHISELLTKERFTGPDVSVTSQLLVAYQPEPEFHAMAGFFLSSAINLIPDERFALDLTGYENQICYLGYKTTKKLTIEGNVGHSPGIHLSGGVIRIFGDAQGDVSRDP